MLWSGIRWIQCFFSSYPSLLLLLLLLLSCSFPCGGISSSVKEISVISVVIAHSLAPSATLALKHTLCVSGHGGCSLSLSLSLSLSFFLFLHRTLSIFLLSFCFPFVPVRGDLLFPNWRKLWCKATSLLSGPCACLCVGGDACAISHEFTRMYISTGSGVCVCVCVCVCVGLFTAVWYKGALSGSAVWIRLQGSWMFDSSSKNKHKVLHSGKI